MGATRTWEVTELNGSPIEMRCWHKADLVSRSLPLPLKGNLLNEAGKALQF